MMTTAQSTARRASGSAAAPAGRRARAATSPAPRRTPRRFGGRLSVDRRRVYFAVGLAHRLGIRQERVHVGAVLLARLGVHRLYRLRGKAPASGCATLAPLEAISLSCLSSLAWIFLRLNSAASLRGLGHGLMVGRRELLPGLLGDGQRDRAVDVLGQRHVGRHLVELVGVDRVDRVLLPAARRPAGSPGTLRAAA